MGFLLAKWQEFLCCEAASVYPTSKMRVHGLGQARVEVSYLPETVQAEKAAKEPSIGAEHIDSPALTAK
jgi:hypothetical protein